MSDDLIITADGAGGITRIDKRTVGVTALWAKESNPVLAVCFEVGLTPDQRSAIMQHTIGIPGVCVVETLEHYADVENIDLVPRKRP